VAARKSTHVLSMLESFLADGTHIIHALEDDKGIRFNLATSPVAHILGEWFQYRRGGRMVGGTSGASRLACRASMLKLMVSITRPTEERDAWALVRVMLVVMIALLEEPKLIGNT